MTATLSPFGFRWWVRGFLKADLPSKGIEEFLTKALGIEGAEQLEIYEGSNAKEICVRVWSDQPIPDLPPKEKI